MCAEVGVKVEELREESEEKGGGIGDCDGDLKRGGSEITLMLLSDVSF